MNVEQGAFDVAGKVDKKVVKQRQISHDIVVENPGDVILRGIARHLILTRKEQGVTWDPMLP